MTKKEFLDYCRRHESPSGAKLEVRAGPRYRDLGYQVELRGCWADCSILSVILYTPNKQFTGSDVYQSAIRKCKEVAAKYQRWLNEFLDAKQSAL